ncbi:MAG: acyl-CoA thioesterase [Pelovirga sp.]
MPAIYSHRLVIPADANDANGHVNNIAYLQWMQDVAILHSNAQGCTEQLYRQLGSSWVVRAHQIEYLRPAFAGEEMDIRTWVCNMQRTRSLRRYQFLRAADGTLLARAQTDWVYVDSGSGRPRKIDPDVCAAFTLLDAAEEPGG